MQFQSLGHQFGHGQEFDIVSQLPGVSHVGNFHHVDPDPRNLAPIYLRPECQMRKDGQFLRGVAAVDVHGRVGLGIAALLGLGQGGIVVHVLIIHLRKDEIARAVKYGVNRLDLIGRQAFVNRGDDRDASGHGGLEGD